MKIGIGLPTALPGVDGPALLDWARRDEDRGFSTLATIDRLVYDCYDPLTVLAAAAAVTTRITLATTVLLASLHTNHVGLAKQAASLDRLAGGRLLLGLAPGPREDDFAAAGVSFRRRGADLDQLLDRVTTIWRDPMVEIGPKPATPGGPRLLFGGFPRPRSAGSPATAPAGFRAFSASPPFRDGAARAIDTWKATGRDGFWPAPASRSARLPKPLPALTCATTTGSRAPEPTRPSLKRSPDPAPSATPSTRSRRPVAMN